MNEPRGHAAMSGAILQPPTRPDADWGVRLHRGVRAACRCAGTARSASPPCWSRPAWSTVTEPVTTIRLDTPAGLVIARVAVSDGHADAVTIENVPAFCDRLDATVDVPGYGDVAYSLAFGGNFYAMVDLDDVGLPFDRARKDDILTAGLAIMDAINDHGRRRKHPLIDGVDHCHHVQFIAPGLGRDVLPARDGDLPGLVRPLAVRHRHVGPDGGAAGPRRTGAGHRLRQRVVHRLAGSSAGWSATTDGRPASRRSSRPSPAGPGSPASGSTCSTRRPVPHRLQF